jgi:hypothetical protein
MKKMAKIFALAALLVAFSANSGQAVPEEEATTDCEWGWCVPLLYWNGSAYVCASICRQGYCCAAKPCCIVFT